MDNINNNGGELTSQQFSKKKSIKKYNILSLLSCSIE